MNCLPFHIAKESGAWQISSTCNHLVARKPKLVDVNPIRVPKQQAAGLWNSRRLLGTFVWFEFTQNLHWGKRV
jgi:hypothetical protein